MADTRHNGHFKPGNKAAQKHGHTWVRKNGTVGRSPTYQSWRSMIARCYDENHPWFHAYGKRGIRVCDEWRGRNGFAQFLADMGKRPSPLLTLDRECVDGGYHKGNCRWADKITQRCNIRALQVLPKPSRIARKGKLLKVRAKMKAKAAKAAAKARVAKAKARQAKESNRASTASGVQRVQQRGLARAGVSLAEKFKFGGRRDRISVSAR